MRIAKNENIVSNLAKKWLKGVRQKKSINLSSSLTHFLSYGGLLTGFGNFTGTIVVSGVMSAVMLAVFQVLYRFYGNSGCYFTCVFQYIYRTKKIHQFSLQCFGKIW